MCCTKNESLFSQTDLRPFHWLNLDCNKSNSFLIQLRTSYRFELRVSEWVYTWKSSSNTFMFQRFFTSTFLESKSNILHLQVTMSSWIFRSQNVSAIFSWTAKNALLHSSSLYTTRVMTPYLILDALTGFMCFSFCMNIRTCLTIPLAYVQTVLRDTSKTKTARPN